MRLEHASTTGAVYRGLERVGSWVPGGSVGRDQLAMAAKVRRHWFNPCRLGSRGHLGADFSLLLYTDLIKKRKPSRLIKPCFMVRTRFSRLHEEEQFVRGNKWVGF